MSAAKTCPDCSTQISPTILICPSCGALTYRDQLRHLHENADQAEKVGHYQDSLNSWTEAATLLPPESRQFALVQDQIGRIQKELAAHPATRDASVQASRKAPPGGPKIINQRAGLWGLAALMLWKFKAFIVMAITKGKFLILGLTKMSTLFSMLLSLGVYWAAWGWKFAGGIIALLYFHEMGHYIRMKSLGMNPKAPVFIPGVGAFVGMRENPASPSQNADIGLAGPFWGLISCAALFGLYVRTHHGLALALAHTGAWINLFNLLPLWQLDGARGFSALSQNVRWMMVVLAGMLWILTSEGLLILIILVTAFKSAHEDAPQHNVLPAAIVYSGLLVTLSLLTWYSGTIKP